MKKKKLKKKIKKLESIIFDLNVAYGGLEHRNKLLNNSVNEQRKQLNAIPDERPTPIDRYQFFRLFGYAWPCIDPED